MEELRQVCAHYNIDMNMPFNKLSKAHKDIVFYGSKEAISFKMQSKSGRNHDKVSYYEGVINHFNRRYMETQSEWIREWIEGFMVEKECSCCHGARLNDDVLAVKLGGKNIFEVTNMSIKDIETNAIRTYVIASTIVVTDDISISTVSE